MVSIGTASAAVVHPREVFQPAILVGACAVIVAHNHPLGDPTPSREDREITQRPAQAGAFLGVSLLDSVLAKTPGIADVVYTPRERIQPTEERTFGGTPLSGRMTVSTPLEIDGMGKASGHVVIEFDEQDRVVNLRVGGFGFKKQQ